MSDPLTDAERSRLERILATRTETTTHGCREWRGGSKSTAEDYGAIWFRGRSDRVHRVFVMLGAAAAYPVKSQVVRHLCGNSRCVNPQHLRIGTLSENNWDTCAHGHRPPVNVPLNEEEELVVRKYADLGWSSWAIAENWFLPRSTVRDYMKRHLLFTQPEGEEE